MESLDIKEPTPKDPTIKDTSNKPLLKHHKAYQRQNTLDPSLPVDIARII